ncbi:MAG: aminotransferase class I/II-fold pyridoxal phosphate-dependent enzyme [Lachnospiraceae bacterium]|nr:aminotransferase class I/II-fold pyridoxal phosphate-dependent enzyme [Lachnospiraceae bacterium]
MNHGGDIYRNKVNMDFSVNLNPLGTPKEVLEAMQESIKRSDVYPDILHEDLLSGLQNMFGISAATITFGSGASELITATVRAINPKTALVFEPAFTGYTHALDAVNCSIKRVILKEALGFKLTEDELEAIKERPDLIIICDPANPTGLNVETDVLISLLNKAKENGCKVILDQSFYLLSDNSEIFPEAEINSLIEKYDNLYIIRSFTKFLAIPGIRAGYLLAAPKNIEAVNRQLPEWNISVVAEEAMKAGIDVLRDGEFVRESLELIQTERDFLQRSLMNLGLMIFKSNTCFVMFKGPEGLYESLLKKGILIRDCSDYPGLFKGFYRIAVKNHKENEALIEAIKEAKYEL